MPVPQFLQAGCFSSGQLTVSKHGRHALYIAKTDMLDKYDFLSFVIAGASLTLT